MSGRPRIPTKVLKLRGAFKKHPERERDREREPEPPLGVGVPPKYFDAAQVERWNELAELGKDWLTMADRPKIEVAAKLWAKEQRNELDTGAGKRFDRLLGDLGFDPVSRSKVKAPPKARKNPFKELAG